MEEAFVVYQDSAFDGPMEESSYASREEAEAEAARLRDEAHSHGHFYIYFDVRDREDFDRYEAEYLAEH